jgi:hypothetical protein
VLASDADMEEMLLHSNRRRVVPVILAEGRVSIGHGGT